jgi:hypothetical protein
MLQALSVVMGPFSTSLRGVLATMPRKSRSSGSMAANVVV